METSVVPEASTPLGLAQIFTLFFLMIGPLKVIGPFAMATREMSGLTRTAPGCSLNRVAGNCSFR